MKPLITASILVATLTIVSAQNSTPTADPAPANPLSRAPRAGATGLGGAQLSFQQRLNSVVRSEAVTRVGGSVLLTTAFPPRTLDEMEEDLAVLSVVFQRGLERAMGDKSTEYRLGVPITLRDNRPIDITFIQGYGV